MSVVRLAWLDGALCAQTDPELWFPASGESSAPAKRVCSVCPVRLPCREHGLRETAERGVWGGLSETDRYRIHARRRRGGVRGRTPVGGEKAA